MYDYYYGHHSFGQFVFAYWWLVFPLMWFVFALARMWMRYRQHRDMLEMMKSYAAQGRDPSELAKMLPQDGGEWRSCSSSPGNEWKGGIVMICIAAAFGIASYTSMLPGTEGPFSFVALITGVIGVALLAMAFITRSMFSGEDKR